MNIALFIDADNINSDYCESILEEAGNLGDIRVKSVFGRCDTFSGKGWKDVAQGHGIQICPQVNNLRGKSAADIALVIEVVKLLQLNTCDGFVIASNDTDYTALVYEIKRRGREAYCFVTKAADNVFVKSCDGVRILQKKAKKTQPKTAPKTSSKQPPAPVAPQSTQKVAHSPCAAKASVPQPKKGTYRQIAKVLKKMGCRSEKAIRNKIKSDYFKTSGEIDTIVKNMQAHGLVTFDANGHATWAETI